MLTIKERNRSKNLDENEKRKYCIVWIRKDGGLIDIGKRRRISKAYPYNSLKNIIQNVKEYSKNPKNVYRPKAIFSSKKQSSLWSRLKYHEKKLEEWKKGEHTVNYKWNSMTIEEMIQYYETIIRELNVEIDRIGFYVIFEWIEK